MNTPHDGIQSSPCFITLLTEHMSANVYLPGLGYMFQSDTFLLALPVSWEYKLNGNITQDLPPN